MQKPPPVSTLLAELDAFVALLEGNLKSEDVDWHWRPSEKEWSLTEVVCHLRDVEGEVHQARFETLIAAENAFLPGVTSDDWVEERRYRFQDGRAALAAFLAARRQTLALLRHLDPAVWQRQGDHAFFGQTSMHELLNLVVKHDQAHWKQISSLLGATA